MDNRTFIDRIREVLADRGWSQNYLETRAGFTTGRVNKILKQSKGRKMDEEDMTALARALGVSRHWLATGEGSIEPAPEADDSPPPPSARRVVVRFADLPGWDEAERKARKTYGEDLPEFALLAVRELSVPHPLGHIDEHTVARWAATWVDQVAHERRVEAEAAGVRATLVKAKTQGRGATRLRTG
jgi:transcriptional regulator with XRE-family HTH domain